MKRTKTYYAVLAFVAFGAVGGAVRGLLSIAEKICSGPCT